MSEEAPGGRKRDIRLTPEGNRLLRHALGTVKLDDETREIGIPSGRSTYLVFVFEKSGLFSASTSTTYDTLIRPRSGYQYTAKVSYHDNIYNVLLNEIEPGGKQGRKISTRNMKTCRPV